METIGQKRYRAGQLYGWLHRRLCESWEEMSDLPLDLRKQLENDCVLTVLRPEKILTSALDGTRKYLFRLADGNVIESVLMRYHHGNSVCISSQVGCRMGCRFCASTIGGRIRDLAASEMLEQVYRIQKETGERVSNVVVMGTGEPLDNLDQLLRFIRILTGEEGQHISQRNITVSTCGLVEGIRRLADEKLQITLALSLHAPTQEQREALMPVAKKYPLGEVIGACRAYFEKTGRRLTFEYSLAAGENDSPEDARKLTELLRGFPCHINLIPVNPVTERKYRQPGKDRVQRFKKELEIGGMNVTIRREMGRDIQGACGQLRRSFLEEGC